MPDPVFSTGSGTGFAAAKSGDPVPDPDFSNFFVHRIGLLHSCSVIQCASLHVWLYVCIHYPLASLDGDGGLDSDHNAVAVQCIWMCITTKVYLPLWDSIELNVLRHECETIKLQLLEQLLACVCWIAMLTTLSNDYVLWAQNARRNEWKVYNNCKSR